MDNSINKTDVINAISAQIQSTVDSLADASPEVTVQINTFLAATQPDIDLAISTDDELSLNLINDRISGKLGSIVLAASEHQKEVINAAIVAMLELALRIGLAAAIASI